MRSAAASPARPAACALQVRPGPRSAIPRAARARQTAYKEDQTTWSGRMPGFCQVRPRSSEPLPATHRGPPVSTRVRILSLVLLASLAARAPSTAAASSRVGHRGGSAWARYLLGSPLHGDGLRARGPEPASFNSFTGPIGFGAALIGSAPVGNGPSTLASRRRARTRSMSPTATTPTAPTPAGTRSR